jgi:hypothetical protein
MPKTTVKKKRVLKPQTHGLSLPILIGLSMQAQTPSSGGRVYLKLRVIGTTHKNGAGLTMAVTRANYDEKFAEALARLRITQRRRSIPQEWWDAQPDFDDAIAQLGLIERTKFTYHTE